MCYINRSSNKPTRAKQPSTIWTVYLCHSPLQLATTKHKYEDKRPPPLSPSYRIERTSQSRTENYHHLFSNWPTKRNQNSYPKKAQHRQYQTIPGKKMKQHRRKVYPCQHTSCWRRRSFRFPSLLLCWIYKRAIQL